ncbi:MAG: NAD(P)/FAD-dependent oxidoreductase [Pseudobdellovibrionaceae bacterium]
MDVLVVGGGIIGVSVALEIQKSGRQVLLIERGKIADGCSYGNAGWITPCFAMPLPQPGMLFKSIGWLLDNESPLHIQPHLSGTLVRWLWHFMLSMNHKKMKESVAVLAELSKYSLDFYRDFAALAKPAMSFEKRGLLMVSATPEGMNHAKLEMDLMRERGIPGEFLSQEAVLAKEPALKNIVKGGVFFPEEAQVEPYPTTVAIAEEFEKRGGRKLLNCEVYDFEVQVGRIQKVFSTQGVFEAELVVMATGSWSKGIAKRLGVNLPILGGKGYSMIVDEGPKKPKHPIMIVEKKIAVTPRADSIRLAGTLELVDQDTSISPARLNAIHKGAGEYLHLAEDSQPRNIWRGLRPCTPDGVPIIDFSKKIQNLFYCTGHQLLGLQSAPGSAKLAGDLIFKRDPVVNPQPFKAARFE